MPRIFISFSPDDAEFAVWLSESLREIGHNTRVDRQDTLGGVQTFDMIQEALDLSAIMLLVISPSAMKSRYVTNEWTYFYEAGKELIPILLQPPEPPDKINYMLASLQYVDFVHRQHEAALQDLHRMLEDYYTAHYPQRLPADVVPITYEYFRDHSKTPALPTLTPVNAVRVHPQFPVQTYLNWHREARSTLRILSTGAGVTGVESYEQLLFEAVERGIIVQILLLDPSSPAAKQRSIDLHVAENGKTPNEDRIPNSIRSSIQRLANLYPELEGLTGNLELRLYGGLPPFAAYICDNHALVGFFSHSASVTDFPALELEMTSLFGKRVRAEFERIWQNATDIDLSPSFRQHVVDANEALLEPLSARELEILALIADGLTNQEIADRLFITLATVKKHINNLYSKLDVTSRTRAVRKSKELSLV